MLTKTQLLNFDPGPYTSVIAKWGTAADAMSSATSTISSAGEEMATWTGPAADQANVTMGNLVTVVADAGGTGGPGLLSEAQDTLAAFTTAVSQQKQTLTDAVTKATSLQCTVGEDGTVTPPSQPAGEPPQVCYADPQQEAARQKAQTAYDNSPAVQNWQKAAQQAPALQTTIQAALKAAAAADARAAHDLEAGIRAGSDVQKIVSNRDANGSAATDLFGDSQTLGDGTKWVDQYVHQAASLLPKAAKGDSGAVSQLRVLTPLSYDQSFSAGLMNQLGAKGLENLPLAMAQKLQNDVLAGQQAVQTDRSNDQTVLGFLSTSLASASNSPDLSPSFVNGLTNNDTVNGPDGGNGAGYWSLGQILGASNGKVAYDPQFFNTVGTSIISYEGKLAKNAPVQGWETNGPFLSPWADNLNLPANANLMNEPLYGGVLDSGGNPVYGLMHAAAGSPAAAQALFAPNGNHENPNLNTALTVLPWTYDKGSTLGGALQAAASGQSPASAGITSDIVHTLAGKYEHDSSYAGDMTGLRPAIANILSQSQNMVAINKTIDQGVSSGPDSTFNYTDPAGQGGIGPGFSAPDLARVLGVVSQDPSAYGALQTAQVNYLGVELNHAVAGGNPSSVAQSLNEGTTTLAVLGGVKTAIAQDGANVQAAQLQQELTTGSYISQGLSTVSSFVPGGQVIGIPAGIANTILGDVRATVHPSTAPTTAGDANELSLANFSRIALANALLRNHAAIPGVAPGDPPFTNPQGQLLSPQQLSKDPAALASLNQWLEQQQVPGSSNYDQVVTNQLATGLQTASTNIGAGGG